MRAAVLLTICASIWFVESGKAQNSTRKLRAKPSALAARAGSAVKWREDLAAARKESRETGKPVFWYVPTVRRSPMDRKPEIDRYMMAGPFSWPTTIELLNQHFIPVRHVASRDEQAEFGIAPRKFIEPGYLVLGADGKERRRLDKITTFEREWFETPLCADVERKFVREPAVDEASERFDAAVAKFEARERDAARSLWRALGADLPDHPLAWKAAAEAEGHGPFAFGFEVRTPTRKEVLASATDGSRAPAGVFDADDVWRIGARFLLRMRNARGGIEDSRYDFGGTDSLPNVYVACTALAGWAVLEHAAARDDALLDEVWPFFDYVADDRNLNPADTDEIVWAQLYRVRLYCRMLDLLDDALRKDAVVGALRSATKALVALQSEGGAWFHEYSNPFVTASALVSLHHAESHGEAVADGAVERGLRALLSTRSKNGAYSYGMRTGRRGASIPAAIGRMALGELALELWGQGEEEKLVAALDASFEHHGLLEGIRKYDDHANKHGHGGFFFWYDMRARSEAIARVADAATRARLAKAQRELIMSLPEIDGCFIDSHELGRCYGTAMGLLSLRALPNK